MAESPAKSPPEFLERRIAAILACLEAVGPNSPGWPQRRQRIAASSGLSEPMVDWALRSSLAPWQPATLRALHHQALAASGQAPPVRQVAVWLAGNLFTAALPALLLPLLLGVSVVARLSRDDAFATLLVEAWQEVAAAVPTLSTPTLTAVRFAHDDAASARALFASADAAIVYGSDATLAQLRGWIPPTTTRIEHGHGLGAIWIPASALPDARAASELARRVALDVAAYDQRGCLSPQAVWVQPGGALSPRQFAALLAEQALPELQRTLPRGPLPPAVAVQAQHWRGVAAARGTLFAGPEHAVAYEASEPPRTSPGWRHIAVHEAAEWATFLAALRPWLPHLKCLGVAGDATEQRMAELQLPANLACRIVAVGQMQQPPLDGWHGGLPFWQGLLR